MIIDVVGMRGSGKTTFCKLMKKEYEVLGREDRSLFDIPDWSDFKKEHPKLSTAFTAAARNFRHYETGKTLNRGTFKRKKAELCLYMALEQQLGDRLFVWDKGLLEVLTYLQIYGDLPISLSILRVWPKLRTIRICAVDSYERARIRKRHEQWDEPTYERMLARHSALVDAVPHEIVQNNGTEKELRSVVRSLFG